jgi:hypothetical protein
LFVLTSVRGIDQIGPQILADRPDFPVSANCGASV